MVSLLKVAMSTHLKATNASWLWLGRDGGFVNKPIPLLQIMPWSFFNLNQLICVSVTWFATKYVNSFFTMLIEPVILS